jgi:long-subunit fatty acid transport protein
MTKPLSIIAGALIALFWQHQAANAQFCGVAGTAASTAAGATDLGNLGGLGSLNPGTMGGGETIPGAIVVKIVGQVKCTACTLEEMGLDESPGDLYQLSQDKTHMVIQVTKADPDIAWDMVEGHKLFLAPGEDPSQLQRLLTESAAGKSIEVIGGVAPEAGYLIPVSVKVK